MNDSEVEATAASVARLETGTDWRGEHESLADGVETDADRFTAPRAVSTTEIRSYDQNDLECTHDETTALDHSV